MRSALQVLVVTPLLAAPLACGGGDSEPAATDPGDEGRVRGLRVNTDRALAGYTLFAPIQSSRVYLLDMEGEVAHRWDTDYGFGGSLHLLEGGELLRGCREEDNPRFHGGGLGGRIQRYDWDGNVLWEYVQADDRRTLHHDSAVLPNGNVLLIAWEFRSEEEALAAGRDPEAVGADGLWPDVIFEVRPTPPLDGEIVWEWRAWDHLVQDRDPEKPGYGDPAAHPERIDVNGDHRHRKFLSLAEKERMAEIEEQMRELGYVGGEEDEDAGADEAHGHRRKRPDFMHTNTVTHHPELDLLVLSVPRYNEVWVIDHSTTAEEVRGSTGGRWGKGGDLLYRWGHPQNYGQGTAEDQQLFFQHQPTWIDGEDGELRMLIFNNGLSREGDYSSVDELVLPFDRERGFLREDGAPFGPAAPAWTYRIDTDDFAPFVSGAQRLTNGNTLICAGITGRVLEVTPEGEIVWDYLNTLGGDNVINEAAMPGTRWPKKALFRATRIAADDARLEGRLSAP